MTRIVRPQDFVWLLLFSALAYVSTDRHPLEIPILIALAALQVLEPKVPFFSTPKGNVISIFLKLAMSYVLNQSKAGNWILASGGNPGAARARGVDVDRTKVSLFVLSSLMASLAGVISSIRTSAANPNSGTQYELEVIAMVVIGGTALTGGRGTIIGTVLGVLILRTMRDGIVLIGVPGLAYNIFIGGIILAMMALHSWLERRHHAGT